MTNPLHTGAAIDEALKPRVAALEEWQMSIHFTALSGRVKKRPLVLFFGRDTFADNSKYLYLQALAAPHGHEVRWCAFELDLLLHAAVAVFCVIPNESLRGSVALNACLGGAARLQPWHGVSVKHLLPIPHLGVRAAGPPLPTPSRRDLASR